MLNLDITGWHAGAIPDSKGLRAQRYGSMDSIQKWVVDSFLRGGFGDEDEWDAHIFTSELFSLYIRYCDRGKVSEYHRFAECRMSSYLGRLFRAVKTGPKRLRGYHMGTLDEAIKRFEEYEKVNLSELAE